jgi:hypothetical protein
MDENLGIVVELTLFISNNIKEDFCVVLEISSFS